MHSVGANCMAADAARWQLYRPPLPKIYTPSSCAVPSAPSASCDPQRCMTRKQLITAKHNNTYADELCDRCECSLCLICAKLVNRWTSPMGQYLESVTTRTQNGLAAPPVARWLCGVLSHKGKRVAEHGLAVAEALEGSGAASAREIATLKATALEEAATTYKQERDRVDAACTRQPVATVAVAALAVAQHELPVAAAPAPAVAQYERPVSARYLDYWCAGRSCRDAAV